MTLSCYKAIESIGDILVAYFFHDYFPFDKNIFFLLHLIGI
jgi:hypothetical protein